MVQRLSKKQRKREKLFQLGASCLQGYFDKNELAWPYSFLKGQTYVCPICTTPFSKDALQKKLLTIEHVPPEKIGGNGICLTCKRCNNNLGSLLDRPLMDRNDFEGFWQGKQNLNRKFPVKLRFQETVVNAHATRSEKGGIRLEILEDHNDSKTINESNRILSELSSPQSGTLEFDLEMRSFNPNRAACAALKSAFLTLFAKFGYTYALSTSGRSLVETFLHPQNLEFPLLSVASESGGQERILIHENAGLCSVAMKGRLLLLPWINANFNEYVDLCMNSAGKRFEARNSFAFSCPQKLEGLLDL